MKQVVIATIVGATAAMFPSGASAQADGCTVIETVPTIISSPGKYCLAADAALNMATGSAIRINSDNVTIDCRNFTLNNADMSQSGSSAAILAIGRGFLTIRNCRVLGFTDGIHVTQPMGEFNSSYYHRIEDNYILGSWRYGIVGYGSAVEIRGNTLWDVGGQAAGPSAGIRLGGAKKSQNKFQIVEDNVVVGTTSTVASAYAIVSDGSIGSVFRGNTISGTISTAPGQQSYGIAVLSGEALTIRDNHVLGRGQPNENGIVAPPNGYNLCFHNRVGVSNQPYMNCEHGAGNY